MTTIGSNVGGVIPAQVQGPSENKTEALTGGDKSSGPPAPGTPEYRALFPNSGVEEIHDFSTLQPDPNRQLWV